ncbi:hypothetical protein GKZ90_0021985 [Flavobacterium sp. MC2016-06]|jgi:hypothetical protein|uniref:hypothetical protein n=1 Tax=Flavobacterium sp. MC2016-06 TaxID=2676308 RepID=UPI0012BA6A63|nr:hypothetical protein [Flavobacterium sp. MC2016-06]MBU3861123.1 hypothetical protein [Flavobacterium sp. MC2016-06]
MKSKIIQLRSFLKRNKIFFDVTAAIILALSSVFIAVKVNSITNKANGISKSETSIVELGNNPSIAIPNDSPKIDTVTK